MESMDIRHNRILAVAFGVIGVLLAVLSLGQGWVGVVAGLVFVVLGIAMAINPMLRIQNGELQVRSPAGVVTKRFPVSAPTDLALDGSVLRHTAQDKKVASLGFMAHKEDVAALRSQLGSGSPGQA